MRWRWVLSGLVLLVVAAVTTLLVFANRLINANRGRIVAAAQQAIGRPVHIGGIEARFFGRPGVTLTDVSIADDPAFGDQPLLAAREATVSLKLWPLLHHELEIGRIEVDQPVVRLIRLADGRVNYGNPGGVSPSGVTAGDAPVNEDGAELAWAVALFDIDDGSVEYTDREVTPVRTVTVTRISLRASDIALDRAVGFELRAAADSPVENVELSGNIGPLASRDSVPFVAEGNVGPSVQIPTVLEDLHVQGNARPQSIDLDEVKFSAFGGDVSGQARLPRIKDGPFSLEAKGSNIDIHQLLQLLPKESREDADGRGAVDVDLHGVGQSEDDLRRSMRGHATVNISDGVLHRFNVLGEVVQQLTSIPTLATVLSRELKPKYSAVLNRSDTKFSSLSLDLRLTPAALDVQRLDIAAEDFGVDGSGVVRDGKDADLHGQIRLSKQVSADIAADTKEARLLFDSQDQIAMPFVYRGVIGQAKPQPDLNRLAASVLGSQGAELFGQLQRSLGRLLGH